MFQILTGDAFYKLDEIKSNSVQCVFTSPNPPITFEEKANLSAILQKCKRVLTETGVLFLQLGDYYDNNGSLLGLPEAMYMLMKTHGWCFRNRLIWHRTEHYKQVDRGRFRIDAEFIYMYTNNKNHDFNDKLGLSDTSIIDAEMENVKPDEFKSGFPPRLVEVCVKTTTWPGDTVLDPFCGTGTTGVVALKHKRNFIGIEASEDNRERLETRMKKFDF